MPRFFVSNIVHNRAEGMDTHHTRRYQIYLKGYSPYITAIAVTQSEYDKQNPRKRPLKLSVRDKELVKKFSLYISAALILSSVLTMNPQNVLGMILLLALAQIRMSSLFRSQVQTMSGWTETVTSLLRPEASNFAC